MANPLQQQAAGYANAAVPTVGSINSQYAQSEGNVHGFTNALVKLLQAGGSSDPYAGAVGSQTAANAAAVARLQQAGSPYAAGSAAAVGGMGDSALGALNQQRGAAIQYQRQLPGIAAARGELANSSLLAQQHTALSQRAQQYQSAYMQALQQLRDYGLQKQQLAQSASQFAANQKYQYAALNARNAQFTASQKQQYNEFLMSQAQQLKLAQAQGAGGYTPSQITAMQGKAQTDVQQYLTSGTPIQAAINHLVSGGILPQIARNVVLTEYGNITPPPKPQPGDYPNTGDGKAKLAYQAALAHWQHQQASYLASVKSFKAYMYEVGIQQRAKNSNPAPGPHPHDRGGSSSNSKMAAPKTIGQQAVASANAQAASNKPDLSWFKNHGLA